MQENLVADDLRVGADIAMKFLDLAGDVLKLVKAMPRDFSTRHVAQQLIRAATSAGANYEEARGAESGSDFIHKIGVAMKETREAVFWLRLVERNAMTKQPIGHLVALARELAAILGASKKTAKRKLDARGY